MNDGRRETPLDLSAGKTRGFRCEVGVLNARATCRQGFGVGGQVGDDGIEPIELRTQVRTPRIDVVQGAIHFRDHLVGIVDRIRIHDVERGAIHRERADIERLSGLRPDLQRFGGGLEVAHRNLLPGLRKGGELVFAAAYRGVRYHRFSRPHLAAAGVGAAERTCIGVGELA
jgi:hypothetical protein